MKAIDLNSMRVCVDTIGDLRTPVVTIDQFYHDCDNLLRLAENSAAFRTNPKDFYPGARLPCASDSYQTHLHTVLPPLLYQHYPNLQGLTMENMQSVFSITTTSEDQLRPIQTIPHIDTHDDVSFASVHYLCAPPFAGTSFYRHRQTGLERISAQQMPSYFAMVKSEMMASEFSPAYLSGSTALFERIHQCPLAFNRMVIYPSNLLHSGDIITSLMKEGSPREARLTLNSFLRFT